MTNGPPSSSAGPSKYLEGLPPSNIHAQPASASSIVSAQTYYLSAPWQTHSYAHYQKPQQPLYQPFELPSQPRSQSREAIRQPSPRSLEFHKHWDAVLRDFFGRLGMGQTLRGLEADLLVMNSEWETKQVPNALKELVKGLSEDSEARDIARKSNERPLSERKLDYVHLANGSEPRSQTSITKSISQLLALSRARNDASNRAEFLYSTVKHPDPVNGNRPPSCARTDAKPIDRDVQMRYDIAKNEEGPLRRTTRQQPYGDKGEQEEGRERKRRKLAEGTEDTEEEDTAERYPGIHERLANIEAHLAVRYVPGSPRSLLVRLKFLEDHIISLEKEYPPWAALHFNQPRRGWPPPPRPTPIIVPSHLTSTAQTEAVPPSASSSTEQKLPLQLSGSIGSGKAKKARAKESSLHRAVMEKLEVQKAMNDLRGVGEVEGDSGGGNS